MEQRKEKLIGQKFGRLTILSIDSVRNSHTYYKCLCDCGNVKIVESNNLTSGKIVSCGCKLRETQDFVTGVSRHSGSAPCIMRGSANKNSTTKVRGVYYNKNVQMYIARINYKRKEYYLVASKDIEVCKKARARAEEAVHEDFLKWYIAYKKETEGKNNEKNNQE